MTDIRFVHGRDDHDLLTLTPPLRNIHQLIAGIESRFDIAFDRTSATVRTTIRDAEPALLAWARGMTPA